AAVALWKIDRRTDLVVPVLLDALKDCPADTRAEAALLIAKIGTGAKTTAPALSKIMSRDENQYDNFVHYYYYEWCRTAPFEALSRLGPEAKVAAPALQEALKDPEALIGISAAEALWKVDHDSRAAIALLSRALKDKTAL